jgi:hypothetical protein
MPTSIPAQALFRRAPEGLASTRGHGHGPGPGFGPGAWLSTLRRSTLNFWAQKLAADEDAASLEGVVVEFGRGIGTWGDEDERWAEMQALDVAVVALLRVMGATPAGTGGGDRGDTGPAAALRLLPLPPGPLPRTGHHIMSEACRVAGSRSGSGGLDAAREALAEATAAVAGWNRAHICDEAAGQLDAELTNLLADSQKEQEDGSGQGSERAARALIIARAYEPLGRHPSQEAAQALLLAAPRLAPLVRLVRRRGARSAVLSATLVRAAADVGRQELGVQLLRTAWRGGQLAGTRLSEALSELVVGFSRQRDHAGALRMLRLAQTGELGQLPGTRRPPLPGAPVPLPAEAVAALVACLTAAKARASSTAPGPPAAAVMEAFDCLCQTAGGDGAAVGLLDGAMVDGVLAALAQQGNHERAWALVAAVGGPCTYKGAGALAALTAAWGALPAAAAQPPTAVLQTAAEEAAAHGAVADARRLLGLLARSTGGAGGPEAALALSDDALHSYLLAHVAAGDLGRATVLASAIRDGGRPLPPQTWADVLRSCRAGREEQATASELWLMAHESLVAEAQAAIADAAREARGDGGGRAAALGRALECALSSAAVDEDGFAARTACAASARATAAAAAGQEDAAREQLRLAAGWQAITCAAAEVRLELAACCASAAADAPDQWFRLPNGASGWCEAQRLALLLCSAAGLHAAVLDLYQEYRQAVWRLDLEDGVLEAALVAATAEPELVFGSTGVKRGRPTRAFGRPLLFKHVDGQPEFWCRGGKPYAGRTCRHFLWASAPPRLMC